MKTSMAYRIKTTTTTPKYYTPKPFIPTCKAKASMVNMKKKEMTNFYEVLSLDSKNIGADTIKRAYRSMALRYHPDVCDPLKREESTRMFIELQRAYETLSDPVKRMNYDYQLGLGSLFDGEANVEEKRRREERSGNFQKELWMNQINELRVRSSKRMARMKRGNYSN